VLGAFALGVLLGPSAGEGRAEPGVGEGRAAGRGALFSIGGSQPLGTVLVAAAGFVARGPAGSADDAEVDEPRLPCSASISSNSELALSKAFTCSFLELASCIFALYTSSRRPCKFRMQKV